MPVDNLLDDIAVAGSRDNLLDDLSSPAAQDSLLDDLESPKSPASGGKSSPVLDAANQFGIGVRQGIFGSVPRQIYGAASAVEPAVERFLPLPPGARQLIEPVSKAITGGETPSEALLDLANRAGATERAYQEKSQATPGPQLARQIGAGVASLAPSLAAAPLGLVAGVATAGLQSLGDTYTQAREKGYAPDKARAVAVAAGVSTGAITALFNRFLPGLEGITQKAMDFGRRAVVKELTRAVGGEAGEEWFDQLVQGAIARRSYDPTKSWKEILHESAVAGLVGGIVAGPLRGIVLAGQAGSKPTQEKTLRDSSSPTPQQVATPPPLSPVEQEEARQQAKEDQASVKALETILATPEVAQNPNFEQTRATMEERLKSLRAAARRRAQPQEPNAPVSQRIEPGDSQQKYPGNAPQVQTERPAGIVAPGVEGQGTPPSDSGSTPESGQVAPTAAEVGAFPNTGIGSPADQFGAVHGPTLTPEQTKKFSAQVGDSFSIESPAGTTTTVKVKPSMLWVETSSRVGPVGRGAVEDQLGVAYIKILPGGTTILNGGWRHGRPIDKLASDQLVKFLQAPERQVIPSAQETQKEEANVVLTPEAVAPTTQPLPDNIDQLRRLKAELESRVDEIERQRRITPEQARAIGGPSLAGQVSFAAAQQARELLMQVNTKLADMSAGLISGTAAESWADKTIKDSLKRVRGTIVPGLDPELLAAYAVKGAAILERGIRGFAEWSAEMARIFPKLAKELFPQIFNAAQQELARAVPTRPLNTEEALASRAAAEADAAEAMEAEAEGTGRFEKFITRVMGREDTVLGRLELTPEAKLAGSALSEETLRGAGLDVVQLPDSTWDLADHSTSQEGAGRKLVGRLTELFAHKRERFNRNQPLTDFMGNLINSVRNNILSPIGTQLAAGEPAAFSQETYQQLYALSQGEASLYGLQLNSLRGTKHTLRYLARNVNVELHTMRYETLGGEVVDPLMKRIADRIREHFTPEEIDALLNESPGIDAILDRLKVKPGRERTKLPQLLRAILDTPIFSKNEIPLRIIEQIEQDMELSSEDKAKLIEAFTKSFAARFAAAEKQALDYVLKSLSKKEKKVAGKGTPLWKKIERAVNVDGLYSTSAVLKSVAKENGYPEPTDEEILRMQYWANREQQLRTLAPAVREKLKNDPKALAKAQSNLEAATEPERNRLLNKIQTQWSIWTKPVNPLKWLKSDEIAKNNALATNELIAADLLFRPSFTPRQIIDVGTGGAFHTPTRALGYAALQDQDAIEHGHERRFFSDAMDALRGSYKIRAEAWRAAMAEGKQAWKNQTTMPNPDRVMAQIAIFDRAMLKAEQLKAQGKETEANLLTLFTWLRFGYRISAVLDQMQGTGAEFAEMRLQAVRTMRNAGKNQAEIKQQLDSIFSDLRGQWIEALAETQRIYDGYGIAPDKTQMEAAAWRVVKSRIYTKMAMLEGAPDDFQAQNELLKSQLGWNLREDGGIGGAIASAMKAWQQAVAGLPFPFSLLSAPFAFHNAIGINANRLASLVGLGLFPKAFGKSPQFAGEVNKMQRKVETIAIAPVAWALAYAAATGAIQVILRWPKDEKEKEAMIAQGIRPGTVLFPTGDGRHIPISMRVGPLNLVSPALAAGGALHDIMVERQKKQERLNAEAARLGVTPGKIEPLGPRQLLGVLGAAAWQTILGGRTASGLIQSYTDYGVPDARRFASGVISPLIPGLPGYQEITRALGTYVNPKLASFWDMLVPIPGSASARVNLLGQPAATPNDMQRIIQTMTGGSYPFPVDPKQAEKSKPYATLSAVDYRPPALDVNKPYVFGNTLRPLNKTELGRYLPLRGRYFSEELNGVTLSGDPATDERAVQQAFRSAEDRALQRIGASRPPSMARTAALTAPSAPAAVFGRARGRTSRRIPRFRRGRIGRGRRGVGRVRRFRTPRLRLRGRRSRRSGFSYA